MEKNIYFSRLAAIWLNKMKKKVTYTWYINLNNYVKHCNEYIGNKKIVDIKPYDIDIIIENLANRNPNTNKPASKKFLQQLVNTLQRIFDFAIENELIYRNPAKGKKKEIPKNAPQKTVEPLTPRQQQLVIDVEHRAKIAAVLMMFTGLRTGELLALEWDDIDLYNYKIFICKRVQKVDTNTYEIKPHTKNGRDRTITIPINLGKWLSKQKRRAVSNLVCPNLDNQLQTPTQWKRLWQSYQNQINYYCYKEACKKTHQQQYSYYSPKKIPKIATKFNPHQLRHTYATLLYISGVDVLTAQNLLGHSDVTTTLKIYTHLDEKFKQLNITKFEKYIKNDLDVTNI